MCGLSFLSLRYGGFVVFKAVFLFTSTVAAAQVARGAARTLPGTRRRFGMVYGFNTLLALVLETALQLAVGSHGLALDVRRQFQVYGGYFGAMGATFAVAAVLATVSPRSGSQSCCARGKTSAAAAGGSGTMRDALLPQAADRERGVVTTGSRSAHTSEQSAGAHASGHVSRVTLSPLPRPASGVAQV